MGRVGFNNPDWTWSELEAALSDRAAATPIPGSAATHVPTLAAVMVGRPGQPVVERRRDGPAWSRKRQPFEAPALTVGGPGSGSVPYAELHCHSNFSFLDGASHPEELVTEAARLGLEALALTDHNGFYGIVRFAEAARELGCRRSSVPS